MNFANNTQKSAGIFVTAEDYLRNERSAGHAMALAGGAALVSGESPAAAAVAAEASSRITAAEVEAEQFERLVVAAEPFLRAMTPADEVDALGRFFADRGADPGDAVARLMTHLGWWED